MVRHQIITNTLLSIIVFTVICEPRSIKDSYYVTIQLHMNGHTTLKFKKSNNLRNK